MQKNCQIRMLLTITNIDFLQIRKLINLEFKETAKNTASRARGDFSCYVFARGLSGRCIGLERTDGRVVGKSNAERKTVAVESKMT